MNTQGLRLKTAVATAAATLAIPLAARATIADLAPLKFLGDISVPELIARVINGLLGLTGALALAYFVYGGAVWMTAAGNEEKIKKAKNTIIWATLGLLVIFSAYAGVRLVFSFLE